MGSIRILFYYSPDNATIVLRIVNSAPGGYGNDLALDDITFRPCGSLITANIIGISTDTVNVCEDNTNVYNFTATASGYVLPVYRWQLSTDQGTNLDRYPRR